MFKLRSLASIYGNTVPKQFVSATPLMWIHVNVNFSESFVL